MIYIPYRTTSLWIEELKSFLLMIEDQELLPEFYDDISPKVETMGERTE